MDENSFRRRSDLANHQSCICVYVCVCVCAFKCMCVCLGVHFYVFVCGCAFKCMCVCLVVVHLSVCAWLNLRICAYVILVCVSV